MVGRAQNHQAVWNARKTGLDRSGFQMAAGSDSPGDFEDPKKMWSERWLDIPDANHGAGIFSYKTG